ncbi:bifunctional aminoglycoside phosphotransferase/ATP-binding protein [Streptomonospora wellingtoniae]|uniref:AAA family ATPase n=1 Tax=Streptomonospora wellingtoniae TaxID=3075544 RepID=A0ABU2L0W1_9ACTN|nr:AAA family ATPase [Streptomonospora sp. DSM 45055]MDT0305194.1 AAA family ATPase [Streptomonospora sp. DSM 45055]
MPPTAQTFTPYAAVRETHAGVVFLVGDRAYKMKKPENFGFLDYSTRELRLAACRREVDLNRRLAPDVYDGVFDVSDARGNAVDHLVAMRRMPDARRLSTLVHLGADVGADLRRIARVLAAFHFDSDRGDEISAQGAAPALRGRWRDSFAQVRALPQDVLEKRTDEIECLALRFVDGRHALLTSRIDQGRIVDGHGDLLTDDVFCLDDGPRILDCLEFDDDLRFVDGLDDAAFLAMDLERLGAADAADSFLEHYADFAGDPAPTALRHHYTAYRAFVRAKVACLRAQQGGQGAGDQAHLLADICLRHLRESAVRLVVVGGTPATGKSTLAGHLADRRGMVRLSSDRVRKERAGLDPLQSAAAAHGTGLYSAGNTGAVYRDLLDRARRLLAMGESVVLDASFADTRHRHGARDLAEEAQADLTEIHCTAPADEIDRRLTRRAREADSVSDADARVARRMEAAFAEWPEAVVVDTSKQDPDEPVPGLPDTGRSSAARDTATTAD